MSDTRLLLLLWLVIFAIRLNSFLEMILEAIYRLYTNESRSYRHFRKDFLSSLFRKKPDPSRPDTSKPDTISEWISL